MKIVFEFPAEQGSVVGPTEALDFPLPPRQDDDIEWRGEHYVVDGFVWVVPGGPPDGSEPYGYAVLR